MRTPAARSVAEGRASTSSAESSSTLSVISSSSRFGSRPVSRRISSTRAAKCGERNCTGETLTAMRWSGQRDRRLAGLAQHPVADRVDQPGFFGDRDEDAGRDQAVRRMMPAQQRLDADHAPRSARNRAADRRPRTDRRPRAPPQLRLDLAAALDGEVHLLARRCGSGCGPRAWRDRARCRPCAPARRGRCRLPARSRRRSRRRRRRSCRGARTGCATACDDPLAQRRRRRRRRATPVCTMANSSPPSRATQSAPRTRPVSRRASSRIRSSPAGWPSVSLMFLKRSRSR